nr:protein FAM92A isoform X4 [Peromyscus maniculatus bairdii]
MPSGLPCPALDRRGARRVATETPARRGGAHSALSPLGRSGGGSGSRAPWRPGAALVGLPPRVPGGAQGKMWRRNLEDRDAQTKQLQDAVTNVEKHFGELCQIFAAYVRKTARLRDKADLLVNEINVYASTETPNLKQGLKNFADEFAKLQDYRQAEVLMNRTKVERLEAKVVEPLKAYGTIVKMKRDDLKATLTARNREAKQLSQLERTRQRNPSDRHVISQAETELQRATIDATRTSRHLEETIDNFEKQKMKDIKNIFSEFITIEMLFHGKALEVFTAAYQNIQKIDEDEDLEVFRNSLYLPDYPSRLDIVRANSKSPLQRSVSAKCTSGTGQITTCRTRKDQQVEDEDDEELDVTEDEN